MHPAVAVPGHARKSAAGPESCPVIRQADLVSWSGVKRGTPLTEKTISELARSLTARLRQIGFAGVKVTPEFNYKNNIMNVDVTWDSCWLLRFYTRDEAAVARTGFNPVQDQSLLESLTFKESGIFDISEASLGREEIHTWYENRGYLMADVVLDYRSKSSPPSTSKACQRTAAVDDAEFGTGVAGTISYFITTGKKAEIRGIRISGNRSIKDSEIIGVMDTKPYDFFGSTGAVLPDQVLVDLEKVRVRYRERGFPDMRILGTVEGDVRVRSRRVDGDRQVLTYADNTRAFDVVIQDDTEGVYLDIKIDEGQQTKIGTVTAEGSSFLRTQTVKRILGLSEGGDFSPEILNKALRKLGRRYAREGFLKSSVTVSCVGRNPDLRKSQCNPADVRSGIVDLFLEVEEGPRMMVKELFIEGAVKTKKSVILKNFPKPGDPYDVEKVSDATRYLNDLGIFESVRVDALGVAEKPPRDSVGIVIRVREAKSKFLDFALGIEKLDSARSADMPAAVSSVLTNSLSINDISNTGFGRALGLDLPDILMTFEARYSDMNFLGRAKRLYLPVKYGLSFTAWDRYASFTPTYLDPNFFVRGLSFRVTPYAEYDRATKALDRIQFGTEIAFSKELVRHLFGSLSFDTGVVRTRDPAQTTAYGAWRYENKLIPSITYDGLDHPINPTKGFFAQASFAYINDVSEGNYLKYEFSGKAFFSVKKLVTFGFSARVGGSQSFSASGDLPQEERYTLGGNRGMRGFSTDGVAQYNPDKTLKVLKTEAPMLDEAGQPVLDDSGQPAVKISYFKPYGGDVLIAGSFEMRFPIIRKLELFGAVFYDFGALAETFTDFSGGSFRHSVGVGIRYMLAGTVPLRLDYGVILDRRCKFVDEATGQCSKREEVGNIHFGILYTF